MINIYIKEASKPKNDFINFKKYDYDILEKEGKFLINIKKIYHLINKDDISYIIPSQSKFTFKIYDKNGTGYYEGSILDDNGVKMENLQQIYSYIRGE